MFIPALFTITKTWKQPKYAIMVKWIKKLPAYVCIYEVCFNHKKEKIMSFVTLSVDFEGIMLSEISQKEKDKYCIISLRKFFFVFFFVLFLFLFLKKLIVKEAIL